MRIDPSAEDPSSLTNDLLQLADELPLAIAVLGANGLPTHLNQTAQLLLQGPRAAEIVRALQAACGEVETLARPAELLVDQGSGSELRLVLKRSRAGFVAMIERMVVARLKAELRAMRSLLAVAAEADSPREAASRTLTLLSALLSGCALVLHALDESEEYPALECIASAGPPEIAGPLSVPLPLDPSAAVAARVAANGRLVHLASLARSPTPLEQAVPGAAELSMLCIPVRAGDQVTAVLSVCGPTQRLGQGELRMIQGLADALGTMIERVRRNAEIAADRAARQSLMDNLPDAIVEQAPDGRISLAAGRLMPILGRSAEGLVGFRLADLVAPEDAPMLARLVSSAHGAPATGEVVVVTPDGRAIPCELSIQQTGAEELSIVRAVFRDLSQRRALEADVKQARDIALLRDKLAAIGQLAAGVAHEINNPLSFVKSNVSCLADYVRELTEQLETAGLPITGELERVLGDMREVMSESLAGIERIRNIVAALKGMSRGRPDENALFDPNRVVQDAVIIFRGAKGVCELDVQTEPVPQVRGSPGGLGQVVLNLLENALDAMGGKGSIKLAVRPYAKGARVTITDSGTGIPDEIRSRIFEPFFTTKELGKGTGLGLYICYEIVEQMKGSIYFETGPAGTTFFVDLPAAADDD